MNMTAELMKHCKTERSDESKARFLTRYLGGRLKREGAKQVVWAVNKALPHRM